MDDALHALHAAEHCRMILICTANTYLLLLSVAAVTHHPLLELWIWHGYRKKMPVHCSSWHKQCFRCRQSPVSAIVPHFNRMWHRRLFQWNWQEDCRSPFELTTNDRSVLERFVTLLYEKGSNCQDVNSTNKHMFTKTGHQIDYIPPMKPWSSNANG